MIERRSYIILDVFLTGVLPVFFSVTTPPPEVLCSSKREIQFIATSIIPDFNLKILPKLTYPQPPKLNLDQCEELPTGYGIPGFRPGVHQHQVMEMFGTPTGTDQGYWPNTQAMFYHLIPNRVSVGFLFDQQSGKLRQTEAAFAQTVDLNLILTTLNSMSGCRLNPSLEAGLKSVHNRQIQRYPFVIDSLKGVIQRDQYDRIYIGIWESDLH